MLKWLLSFLHTFCDHDPDEVSADINEGDAAKQIRWCRICGAIDRGSGMELARSPWIRWRGRAAR